MKRDFLYIIIIVIILVFLIFLNQSKNYDITTQGEEIQKLNTKIGELNYNIEHLEKIKEEYRKARESLDFLWDHIIYGTSVPEPFEENKEDGTVITGYRLWINAEIGTPEGIIEMIVKKELELRKDTTIIIDKQNQPVDKILFYVYNRYSPVTGKEKKAGEDIADYKYSWEKGGELKLEQKPKQD